MSVAENFKYVDGTTSNKSYAVFARRGDCVLALRPYPMASAAMFGHPDKSLIQVRIRSTKNPGLQFVQDEGNVTSLSQHVNYAPADAWPSIEFEKSSPEYASAQVALFMRGTMKDDEQLVAMMEKLVNGDFVEKLVSELVARVGEENLVIRPTTIEAYLREKMGLTQEKLEKVKARLEAKKADEAAIEEKADNEAVLLSAMFTKLKGVVKAQEEQEEAQADEGEKATEVPAEEEDDAEDGEDDAED